MTPRPDSLTKIEAAVWRQLAAAVADKGHGWRTPVLATVDGDAADARTVILRDVEAATKKLLVYTDARSGKVAQLQARPHGTLVMWSHALGWQLRCRARLAVETSGLATSSRWARIRLLPSAQDYLSPVPPGAPLADPRQADRGAVARDHFAVVTAEVESLDWLELHRDGHRRAVFDTQGARWVQP